jgi:hypothetical protein
MRALYQKQESESTYNIMYVPFAGDFRLALHHYRLSAKSQDDDFRNKGLEGTKRVEEK